MKRGFDKEKGFLKDSFEKSLVSSNKLIESINFDDFSSAQDLREAKSTGRIISPIAEVKANTSKWTHKPSTPSEKELYYGTHIHSEDNPLGLHTHNPGGKLSGGHTHGPQNRFGEHHHKDMDVSGKSLEVISVDGKHIHKAGNYPDGGHTHTPENFG